MTLEKNSIHDISVKPEEDTKLPSQATTISKRALRANLSNCKYEIVETCVKSLGYKTTVDPENFVLFWLDTGIKVERMLAMQAFQKINHFPGMDQICRKDCLARNVNRLSRRFPKVFNFFPRTFVLPSDKVEFLNYAKEKKNACFIAKPGKIFTFFSFFS